MDESPQSTGVRDVLKKISVLNTRTPARPPMSSGTSKVSMAVTNSSIKAASAAGRISGKEMRRKVRQFPAPVMVEASSRRGSIALKEAERSR